MMTRGYIPIINEAEGFVLRYRHITWTHSEYEYVTYKHYEDAVKAYKNVKGQSMYTEVKLYELMELIG